MDNDKTVVRVNCSGRPGTGGILRWQMNTVNMGTYVHEVNGLGDVAGRRPPFVTNIVDYGKYLVINTEYCFAPILMSF